MDLPDLYEDVKKIWTGADKWRYHKGHVQFHLDCYGNDDAWFYLFQAPEKVERFVTAWVKAGGLESRSHPQPSQSDKPGHQG